jgi:hypothetical protein
VYMRAIRTTAIASVTTDRQFHSFVIWALRRNLTDPLFLRGFDENGVPVLWPKRVFRYFIKRLRDVACRLFGWDNGPYQGT